MPDQATPPSPENVIWLTDYRLEINDQLAAARAEVPDVPASQLNVADKPATTDWSANDTADANLAASVQQHGVTRPVIVWRQTQQIIDGIRLYRVAQAHNRPYPVRYIDCASLEEAIAERVRYNLGTRAFPSGFARAWAFVGHCQPIIAKWREAGRRRQGHKAVCPAPDKADQGEAPPQKIDWLRMAADAVNVPRSEVYYANRIRDVTLGKRKSSYPPQKLERDFARAFRGELSGYSMWENIRCHHDRESKEAKFHGRKEARREGRERDGDGGSIVRGAYEPGVDHQVIHGDMFDVLPTLPPGLIRVFLFSPPYYLPAHKDRQRDISTTFYDLDGKNATWLATWPAYQAGTRRYCELIDHHLRSGKGGYVVINVANTRGPDGRWYYHTDLLRSIAAELGWFDLGEWIWAKHDVSGRKYAWGSPDNPIARINHEYLCVFRVGTPARGPSTLFGKELQKYTMTDWGEVGLTEIPAEWRIPSRWEIAPASHPLHAAIFPRQLVYRCLQLWSGHGDMICDPYCGVGTTGYVASLLGRRFLGIEQGEAVAAIAAESVAEAARLRATNSDAAWRAIRKLAPAQAASSRGGGESDRQG